MTLSIDEVKTGLIREHEAFAAFIEGLTPEEWATPSPCEGWTCGDVAAHVTGSMADVVSGNLDGLGTPEATQREVDEHGDKGPGEMAEALRGTLEVGQGLLGAFDDAAWHGPAPGGYGGTLLQGVEAMYFDAYMHANDIRKGIGRLLERGEGLRCAVHHVAAELEKFEWGPATLAFDGMEEVPVGGGGGRRISGDALEFVLAATGRGDPEPLGLDASVNIYAA